MRVALFCENKYALGILQPLYEYAMTCGMDVLWYIHASKINIADLDVQQPQHYTSSIQELNDFKPDVVFVPGNIVPYYLPGVKVQVFHGYAAEKKDHWIIRRYFDLYLTQGPYFTSKFKELSLKYKDFDVVETGWTKQDWIFNNKQSFDSERKEILSKHGKSKIVLYAPTFSPKLTSLPHIKESLIDLVNTEDIVLIIKPHPLTRKEWIDEYRALALSHDYIVWGDDANITKYELMADLMISDTSSTVYEFLLLDKPVITLNSIAKDIYWTDIKDPSELKSAYYEVFNDTTAIAKRKWIVENYDPYMDGLVCQRMFSAVQDFINKNGVPSKRKVNLWRKYTSIKTFGSLR